MSDLLSQEEVNALLQSVPLVEESLHRPDAYRAARSELPASRHRAVRYDFKRAGHVSQSAIQNLHFVHERYARSLSLDLSGYLRTTADIVLLTVEQMSYAEFLMSLPETTCVNVAGLSPSGGRVVLEVNPTLAFAVVEKLMGGASESPTVNREITTIEQQLLAGFIEMALRDLQDAWQPLAAVRIALERQETSPHLVQVVAADEAVVVVVFEVTVGQSSGMMNLCIPSLYLGEFATPTAAESPPERARPATPQERRRVEEVVARASSRLSARLGASRLPIREIIALQVGDVVPLRRDAGEPVAVEVAGRPKFQATLGVKGTRRAVKIVAPLAPSSEAERPGAGTFRPVRSPHGGSPVDEGDT